ncbi:class I SAM-dependent methyltransferase [Mangrovimonas sp. YM274]|uniref:class I SAM-dependent methyltransferase n=1 Tax=Mangrovimonas sp. YM274 TaxID=3070660 RepID=UPI0027DC5947|nr:class I SAM-dependent methyltransferase [Mangrovimonas sp. YM274]WMI69858.1 class I SAM-dependent methyltransferase [Mangrovimonas sp. YM274]
MKLVNFVNNPRAYVDKAKDFLVNKGRVIMHAGDNVKCDICNWKGTQFFKGKCPKCRSLQRTRLMPFALEYFNLLQNPKRVLHIAPNLNENTYMAKNLQEGSTYDRLNIRPVKHINIVQDITRTNLPSENYDLVVAWHVLEHIVQDVQAIEEVYRLLKPGGHFLVSVPIFPLKSLHTFENSEIPYKDFEKVHGHYDHCRSCGLDYYLRFEKVGFNTQELKVQNLPPSDTEKFGLFEDHVVWCFQKS